MDLTVLQDVTVEAGGAIQADGQGYGVAKVRRRTGALVCNFGRVAVAGTAGWAVRATMGAVPCQGGGLRLGASTHDRGQWRRRLQGGAGGAGGGAIRLNVGGTLTVEGQISANGLPAAWGQGGGGAGGSVWLTVGTLAGTGVISANGGPSVAAYGGGGGGGRVAIYATNTTGNVVDHVEVNGGGGYEPGESGATGTFQLQSGFLPLQGISFAPASAVMSAVSNAEVFFNIAANPTTVVPAEVTITTPGGPIPASQITVEMLGGTQLLLGFPPQNVPDTYQVLVGPQIEDLYGNPMPQAYEAAFVIAAPLISGTVCDTNGLPVASVALQPDGGLGGVLTATNGQYSLPVLASWTGMVTPSKPGWMFVPGARAYTNLTANVTNQNYILVDTIAPALRAGSKAPTAASSGMASAAWAINRDARRTWWTGRTTAACRTGPTARSGSTSRSPARRRCSSDSRSPETDPGKEQAAADRDPAPELPTQSQQEYALLPRRFRVQVQGVTHLGRCHPFDSL